MQLEDNFGRQIKYLRLSVTDRCNLRCFYCMPAEGIHYLPKNELLTYEEMLRIAAIFSDLGIEKIRITGGEPFARKDLIEFLEKLSLNDNINSISLTTNGILTKPFLPRLKDLGIDQINLSLDSLSRQNFHKITRRDEFITVMETFRQLLELGFKVKINAVVMDGINDHEINDLARLVQEYPVSVRFIEEMPFNGSRKVPSNIKWTSTKILSQLKTAFPDIRKVISPANSTSDNYIFDGAKGNVGIIAAYTRSFCGTCDRIRITSTGEMRTCLYGSNVLNIKDLLRNGTDDKMITSEIIRVVQKRAKDGFEAERIRDKNNPVGESMSIIGG
jgi:molybdenum cofactor biosynthesis protein A